MNLTRAALSEPITPLTEVVRRTKTLPVLDDLYIAGVESREPPKRAGASESIVRAVRSMLVLFGI